MKMLRRGGSLRTEPITYRAFLLRVWTRPEAGGPRASLRDIETGEAHAFDDLGRLREWSGREIDTPDDQAGQPG